MRWTWRTSPSSSSAAAMNSRWSRRLLDERDDRGQAAAVSRGERRQPRVVEAHRDLGRRGPGAGSPVSPSSGNTTRPAPSRRAPRRAARGGARGSPRGPRAAARPGRGRCGAAARPESRPVARPAAVGGLRRVDVGEPAASVVPAASRRSGASARRPPAAGGRDGDRRSAPRRVAAAAPGPRPRAPRRAGRLELLARAVDLLGEVAGDLVARRERPEQPGPRSEQRSGLPSRSRSQHRVWKWQPDGGLTGDGTSPLRMIRRRRRSTFGSGIGTADRSATVYGWSGRALSSRDGASSTIRPRYITAIRSLMWRTTDRSWAMNR